MDGEFLADVDPTGADPSDDSATDERPVNEAVAEDSPVVEATSNEYLGRWNRLVSTTNWEKGRIISEWRSALIEAGAPTAASTDEAWSRRVGNVTPQHAGRLRRVYQRFGSKRQSYSTLFWSHFQAALDWNDAEMWLEGAVQSAWSISQMQAERSRTMDALEPPAEPVEPLTDEDSAPIDAAPAEAGRSEVVTDSMAEVHDTADRSEDLAGDASSDAPFDSEEAYGGDQPEAVRPFENLPSLPADIRDAFEAFKLAIIHHRLTRWQEISCDDLLAALDALRKLAEAPTE